MFHVKQPDISPPPPRRESPPLQFGRALARHGVGLSGEQNDALALYAGLLLEWNQKVNLISRKDEQNVWTSHILHALAPLLYLKIPAGLEVLDLGTGGGLPGIPLAIARPDMHVTLVDSIRKKTAAVEEMLRQLPLGNVQVRTSRVEELPRDPRTGFDLVLTRAVAPLTDLLKWTRGLYRRRPAGALELETPAGPRRLPLLIAWKGGDLADELRQAGLRHPRTAFLELPVSLDQEAGSGLEGKKLLLVQPGFLV